MAKYSKLNEALLLFDAEIKQNPENNNYIRLKCLFN